MRLAGGGCWRRGSCDETINTGLEEKSGKRNWSAYISSGNYRRLTITHLYLFSILPVQPRKETRRGMGRPGANIAQIHLHEVPNQKNGWRVTENVSGEKKRNEFRSEMSWEKIYEETAS